MPNNAPDWACVANYASDWFSKVSWIHRLGGSAIFRAILLQGLGILQVVIYVSLIILPSTQMWYHSKIVIHEMLRRLLVYWKLLDKTCMDDLRTDCSDENIIFTFINSYKSILWILLFSFVLDDNLSPIQYALWYFKIIIKLCTSLYLMQFNLNNNNVVLEPWRMYTIMLGSVRIRRSNCHQNGDFVK